MNLDLDEEIKKILEDSNKPSPIIVHKKKVIFSATLILIVNFIVDKLDLFEGAISDALILIAYTVCLMLILAIVVQHVTNKTGLNL